MKTWISKGRDANVFQNCCFCSAYWLVQVAWTVTSRRQLRPIKSTYILQGKESAKACCNGETMKKEKRDVKESIEFSSKLERIRWPKDATRNSLLNETFNIKRWPLRSRYISMNTTRCNILNLSITRKAVTRSPQYRGIFYDNLLVLILVTWKIRKI